MATNETMKITYLIEAVDKATAVLKQVDKEYKTFKTSVEGASKTTEQFNKVQEQTGNSLKKSKNAIKEQTSLFDKMQDAILKTGAVVGTLGVGLLGLASSRTGVRIVSDAFIVLEQGVVGVGLKLAALQARFPALGKVISPALSVGLKSVNALRNAFGFVNLSVSDSLRNLKAYGVGVKSIGKTMVDAVGRTELLAKGLAGLATRLTVAGGALTLLGTYFLKTDSIILKFTGGSLVALAVAVGGLAVVFKTLITVVGELIFSIGTGLVNAMQSAVKEFVKTEKSTFAFKFVVDSLNESTKGATGSFELWTEVIDDFRKQTGFARKETQDSVSELLRFGNSIGLTRKQMLKLLPVIGDLAIANHKDLFTSTLAVVEALNGQTVMLQNMGVNLGKHAISHSKAAKAIDKTIGTMTEHEKVQVRYNVLLDKSNLLQGLAAESLNTTAGAIRKQQAVVERLSAAIGEGAAVIENQYNLGLANMLIALEDLSTPFLETTGLVGALSGRALQAIGLFVKWSFNIVLVTSSIKALNVVLANNIIQKYLGSLARASIITETLASKNAVLARTLSELLTRASTTGLGITSVFKLLTAGFAALTKAAIAAVAPFALLALKVGIVVGVLYTIYEALKLVEKETMVFSNAWKSLVQVFKDIVNIEGAQDFLVSLGTYLKNAFTTVVFRTAQAIIFLYQALLQAQLGWRKLVQGFDLLVLNDLISAFEEMTVKVRIFALTGQVKFNEYKIAVADFVDNSVGKVRTFVADVGRFFGQLPGKLLGVIGVQSAWADEIAKTAEETKALESARDALRESENENLRTLTAQIDEQYALLEVLKSINTEKEKTSAAELAGNEAIQQRIESTNQLINSLETQLQTELSGIKKIKDEAGKDVVVKVMSEVDKKAFADALQKAADDPFKIILSGKKITTAGALGIGAGIANAMTQGAEGARNLLVGGVAKGIDTMIPGLGSALKPLIEAFTRGPKFVRKMVLDFLKSLPKLAANLIKSVPAFIEAIIDGIPLFIEALIEELAGVIDFIVESIPKIIIKLVNLLPNVINKLVDGMPQLIESLVKALPNLINALIKAMPDVAISLAFSMPLVAFELAKSMPSVAFELAKSMPSVALNFITSIAKDAPKLLSKVFSGFGSNIFGKFKDLITKFNPINLFTKLFKLGGSGPGPVEKFIGLNFPIVKFAQGGLVPGAAKVRGDSEMNDIIPALLSPGEVVLPRSVVSGGLSSIMNFLEGIDLTKGMVMPKGDMVQKFGLGSFVGGLVGSVGGFFGDAFGALGNVLGAAASSFLGGISALTQANPGKFKEELEKIPNSIENEFLNIVPIPKFLKRIIASLRMLGAKIDVPKFLKNPVKGAKNAVLSVLDVFKPAFKKLIQPAKLAMGGEIPFGFPNDSFPAMLSSGETVIRRDTTNELKDYLANQRRRPVSQDKDESRQLLKQVIKNQTQLIELLQERNNTTDEKQMIEITTNVMLEEQVLAQSMEQVAVNGWTR